MKNPGTWKDYLSRNSKSNKSLTELARIYLMEIQLYEQHEAFERYLIEQTGGSSTVVATDTIKVYKALIPIGSGNIKLDLTNITEYRNSFSLTSDTVMCGMTLQSYQEHSGLGLSDDGSNYILHFATNDPPTTQIVYTDGAVDHILTYTYYTTINKTNPVQHTYTATIAFDNINDWCLHYFYTPLGNIQLPTDRPYSDVEYEFILNRYIGSLYRFILMSYVSSIFRFNRRSQYCYYIHNIYV